jgi:hypothetical protein
MENEFENWVGIYGCRKLGKFPLDQKPAFKLS